MTTCTHPNIPHINLPCFSLDVAQRIILSIVVLETIFQVQEKIWAPKRIKKGAVLGVRDLDVSSDVSAKRWTRLWTVPNETLWWHLQNRSVWHTPAIPMQVSDKVEKKIYGFLGDVCSPISSMQQNLLQIFIWLWQYVSSASGYSPHFSTTTLSSNVIHLAHVDWTAEEIARLPQKRQVQKV